jgi:hypothetical protein
VTETPPNLPYVGAKVFLGKVRKEGKVGKISKVRKVEK